MKYIKRLLILMVSLFIGIGVYANDIKKISMDIYVDNNGDAHVTEEWTAKLTEGTEGYKPYYNLGASEIKDFEVSLNNSKFTTLSNWDVNASFNEKANKAGLHYISNGVELCFGITNYGTNTYVMKYTITNFVSTLDDADMIYWTLIPYGLSDKPDYTYIKIYSDERYSDELPVWGYGNYGGYAYVYDGYIELVHEDELDNDEYMTVLVKFPKGTFNTSSVLNNNFDYYYNMAQEGAEVYVGESGIGNIIAFVFNIMFVALIVIFAGKSVNTTGYGSYYIKIDNSRKKFKDINYFRDIPCNKDIFLAYWYAAFYGLIKNKTDFLGAILLKWLRRGNTENVTVTSKILKKESRAIKLLNKDNLSPLEIEIFDMMYDASEDGILEKDEFTKWCKKHYTKILSWFDDVIDEQTKKYIEEGFITEEKKFLHKEYFVSETLDRNAIELAGLKKFLNEFSQIKDKQSIEVQIWDEYLMFAQIFGIADKVAKEFKNLYPNVITDDVYNDVMFVHTISHEGVHAASVAKSRAESYSSGGGGFSSGGGGGGSFGGGGGGGGFR